MQRRWRLRRLALAIPLLAACGRSPSSPAEPPSGTVAVRDGWTEAAVLAQVTPDIPALGAPVTVRARGYLTREAVYDGSPIHLWPQSEDYVRTVVYGPDFSARGRLVRWREAFTVTASDDLLGDAPVRAVLEEAVAEATRATGLAITFGPDGPVRFVLDPSDPMIRNGPFTAVTRYHYASDARIVSAQIVFKDRTTLLGVKPWGNVVLHELGHALGLGHSPNRGDVMCVLSGRREARSFGRDESVALKLMYRFRQPGNLPPDRAPEWASGPIAARTVVVFD